MYKLSRQANIVIHIGGGLEGRDAHIPMDNSNPHYQEYLAWVNAGNTAAPADAPTAAEQNAPILQQIDAEEKKQLRAMREHVLGDTTAVNRLRTIDDNIKALRVKLVK